MDPDLSLLPGFFVLLTVAGVLLACVLPSRMKAPVAFATVLCNAAISTFCSVSALRGVNLSLSLNDIDLFGNIPIIVDPLSGWFILLINFTAVTGAWYGMYYMRVYSQQTMNLSLHWLSYIVMHASLLAVCTVQNSLLFLVVWELMTLSCFVLIIFEHTKKSTLKAGMNFLVQSHIGVLILTLSFIWIISRTGSYDFSDIREVISRQPALTGTVLSLSFFAGFAFKAGFVPFHTWLPYAHPAAPAHISGVMSGIIIKAGIYGILRMLLLIPADYTVLGYIILFISVCSGLYGVMLAIVQHNLKKLLAYHSIENIGIIGIGIGLGCIGIGTGNGALASLGFAGGILHVANHSLFKSLLFYCAGNVYQSSHTMNIERLGGLIKHMPHTAVLFLLSAVAICGLPPLNGFVSEFLIYMGLFKGLAGSAIDPLLHGSVSALALIFSVFGLALIGGLALLCFTKAFGIIFLGTARRSAMHVPQEAPAGKAVPMYMALTMIVLIGLFPGFYVGLLSAPVAMFSSMDGAAAEANVFDRSTYMISAVGACAAGFIVLCSVILFIRNRIVGSRPRSVTDTWGCGYTGSTGRMQYTASSFIRSYRKLAEPVLSVHKKETEINGIFPKEVLHETHPHDRIEERLIDKVVWVTGNLLEKFSFLQSGNAQHYVLYGILFILAVLLFPVLSDGAGSLLLFLKNF